MSKKEQGMDEERPPYLRNGKRRAVRQSGRVTKEQAGAGGHRPDGASRRERQDA